NGQVAESGAIRHASSDDGSDLRGYPIPSRRYGELHAGSRESRPGNVRGAGPVRYRQKERATALRLRRRTSPLPGVASGPGRSAHRSRTTVLEIAESA